LIPAYAKQGVFGPTFSGTTFLHIAHNLELSYEGRLFPQPRDGALEHIHQLPRDWLVNPAWGPPTVINPSRCAIMLSDQWATVSPSYKHDLLNTSPLADLLRQKPQPFAFPNGIPVEARIKKLNECAPDHPSAKRLIQKKYFGYQELDDAVPLLAFVGRITTQKGVHLILDAAETLITKYNYRINILVGGMANNAEAYSAQCAHKMRHLKDKYPNCFWADPNQFFTDGSLVNRGTDFGLMPSIFEPGGIVQHEFFIGGTPVIAFKTGGLKDSVFEYNWDSETGNGYTFESHYVNDFIFACERALGTYKNKAKYLKLRQNAFDSTMDGERVSRAWLAEFFRLRGKVFVD
jgi:starch synthase